MLEQLSDQEKAEIFLGLHSDPLPEWNESIASRTAEADGLVLTDKHFEVLHFIRRSYQRFGQIKQARTLTQALETRFMTSGGKKYLYMLFPLGPVTQGCRIAGIPVPGDSLDASFGTAA